MILLFFYFFQRKINKYLKIFNSSSMNLLFIVYYYTNIITINYNCEKELYLIKS